LFGQRLVTEEMVAAGGVSGLVGWTALFGGDGLELGEEQWWLVRWFGAVHAGARSGFGFQKTRGVAVDMEADTCHWHGIGVLHLDVRVEQ